MAGLGTVQKSFPAVRHLVDAGKEIELTVLDKDLKEAKTKNHNACAIAIAAKRQLALDGVIASVSTVYLIKGTTATRYSVPESVSREMVSFDRGADFDSGTYKLIPPYKAIGASHDRETVRQAILRLLRAGGVAGVNGKEFIGENLPNFSQRISELNADGFLIASRKAADCDRFLTYYLEGEPAKPRRKTPKKSPIKRHYTKRIRTIIGSLEKVTRA